VTITVSIHGRARFPTGSGAAEYICRAAAIRRDVVWTGADIPWTGAADMKDGIVRAGDVYFHLSETAAVLRGMAYEHRLHILVLLWATESTPAALAKALTADVTLVAHHLRFLRDANLIRRQRRGRNVYYALANEATERLIQEVVRYAEWRPGPSS